MPFLGEFQKSPCLGLQVLPGRTVGLVRSIETDWETLGKAIRKQRLAKSLTLVSLAKKVELSQPFLSQVENGKARPSLMSLHRIAEALGTTPQAFFSGPLQSGTSSIFRAADARLVEVDATVAQSTCHVLLAGAAPFHLLEFDGLPTEFLEYFEHDGFEATYVMSGRVEIDIAGTVSQLEAGDTISYPSRLPHRLRSIGKKRARVLLIETKVDALQDRSPGRHSPIPKRSRKQATKASEPLK
jgi:transcriptional regulator with XRE-family HTH domain